MLKFQLKGGGIKALLRRKNLLDKILKINKKISNFNFILFEVIFTLSSDLKTPTVSRPESLSHNKITSYSKEI
jgi:hypothetical protein